VGQAMCYYILPSSGIPIVHSTIQPITKEEQMTDTVKQELVSLDEAIQNKLGKPSQDEDVPNYFEHEQETPDHITPEFEPVEESMPEADEWDPDSFDKYILAEVKLPKGDQEILG
jgi:hypothetical protein